MRKIRLNSLMLRLAACFIDYESAQLIPTSRIVEYGYVFGKLMQSKPGKALDIGCVALHNYISPSLAMSGWQVDGIDIRDNWAFKHPNFHFINGDMRSHPFKSDSYDAVFCISTLEHIGLAGYYGNTKLDLEGDAKTVENIHRVLKPKGKLFLTVPYADTYKRRPGARVYNRPTLSGLLYDFKISDDIIYALNGENWIRVPNTVTEGVICLEAIKL